MKYLLQQRCRTTWSCWHKALLSGRRANRSGKRGCTLHCGILFGRGPEARRPAYMQSGQRPAYSVVPVTRVRIDGGVVQSFISKGFTVIIFSNKKKKKNLFFCSFLSNFLSELTFLSCFLCSFFVNFLHYCFKALFLLWTLQLID